MPLFNCPDCNHNVSTNAVSCPNCGNTESRKFLCTANIRNPGTMETRVIKVFLELKTGEFVNQEGKDVIAHINFKFRAILSESAIITEDSFRWKATVKNTVHTW